jgi:hypothetical protein
MRAGRPSVNRVAQVLAACAGMLLLVGPSQADAAGGKHGSRLRITGHVTLAGSKLPAGRKARVLIAREFPGLGGAAEVDVPVDAHGNFRIDPPADGEYWLLAYLDADGSGKYEPGKEISGYAMPNPVPIGNGRDAFATKIDLDPILVMLTTRFQPAIGSEPARRLLESIEVVPFDPRSGRFLEAAEVLVSQRKIEIAPEGGIYRYLPDPPEEAQPRYVVEVLHPVFGRSAHKRVISPRAFNALPEGRVNGASVEWTSPPWANFSAVRVLTAEGDVALDRPAQSPLDLTDLTPGSGVRVRVGRVDVQHAGDISIAVGDLLLPVPTAAPPSHPAADGTTARPAQDGTALPAAAPAREGVMNTPKK